MVHLKMMVSKFGISFCLADFQVKHVFHFRGLNLPSGYSLLHYAAECVTDPEAGYRPAADGVEGICYDLLMWLELLSNRQSLVVATLWPGCDVDFKVVKWYKMCSYWCWFENQATPGIYVRIYLILYFPSMLSFVPLSQSVNAAW